MTLPLQIPDLHPLLHSKHLSITLQVWKAIRNALSRGVKNKRLSGGHFFTLVNIDDCTRFRVLGIYTKRTAANSKHFLEERMVEEFPFPIQRIQTDRGAEFFGLAFQKSMRRFGIKFRPIRPYAPHLNGKVERSQRTDKVEFYPLIDLNSSELEEQVEQWQFDYNWHRPHSALGGITPIEKTCQLSGVTPSQMEIEAHYDPKREHFQNRDYSVEMAIRKVKRC
ncbi:MAG: transposase family protein [Aridibacter famidurans]|nr:transposase family protein [Aridibacter famidurans]